MIKRLLPFVAILLLAGCGAPPLPAPVAEIKPPPEEAGLPTAPAPASKRPDYHIISEGETLSSIALNYGLDYRELALWNNIRDLDLIQVGSRLHLFSPADEPVVAVVKPKTVEKFTEFSEAAAAPADKANAAAPVVRKGESTIIGADAPLPANTPVKTAPRALKYVYSKSQLEKLRERWNNAETIVPVPSRIVAAVSGAADDNPQALRRRFGVDWSWPAAGKVIKKFNENGKGIDIAGSSEDIVYASADGKVIYVNTGIKSYGLLIIIKHNNDYLTAYAHNDKAFVKEGDIVKRGDKIAAFGKSGAQNVMLHFEVRKGGKPFDPLQVLPPFANES